LELYICCEVRDIRRARCTLRKAGNAYQYLTSDFPSIYLNAADFGYDWGPAGNALGFAGLAFNGLESFVANDYWWFDSKGKFNSVKILEKGKNGKYLNPYRGIAGTQVGYNSALRSASAYKVAGNVVGGLGLLVSGAQLYNNQIAVTEFGWDAVFGIIGLFGPIGAGISATYFVGKLGYEYFSGKTVFDKPR
jgi:hypothetical protein